MSHDNTQDRAKAIAWAQDMLKKEALIIDLETTGFKNAYIVQIGIINTKGDVLLDQLVRPALPIPKSATQVHGITDAMVQDAPPFKDLYVKLSSLLAGKAAIAYNVEFDRAMLAGECKRLHLPLPRPTAWECAMKAYAPYWGSWNKARYSYVWQSLSKACNQQGIGVQNAHRAIGDCQMTLALINAMAAG